MSGHPGATDRLLTLAQLKQQRNLELPQWLLRYSEIRGRYIQFSAQSPENERITADLLNSIENAIKVRRKMLDALHEDTLLARKAAEEDALQKSIAKNAKLKKSTGDPWGDIDKALAAERALFQPYTYLEDGAGFQGRLVTFARTLVRGAAERDKPNNSAFPRIHRQRAAAHRTAARRPRAGVHRARRDPRSATASRACASGWAPITRWCASSCRRNRRPRSPSVWSPKPSSRIRRCGWSCGKAARQPSRRPPIR